MVDVTRPPRTGLRHDSPVPTSQHRRGAAPSQPTLGSSNVMITGVPGRSGRCVVISLSGAALVLLWLGAAGLLAWSTLGGPWHAGWWGIFCSSLAAVGTVVRDNARSRGLLTQAFELGRQERPRPIR